MLHNTTEESSGWDWEGEFRRLRSLVWGVPFDGETRWARCTAQWLGRRRRTYLDSPRSTVLAVLRRLAAIDHGRLGCRSVRVEACVPEWVALGAIIRRAGPRRPYCEARSSAARVPSPAVGVWCCVQMAGSGEVVVENGNQIAGGGS